MSKDAAEVQADCRRWATEIARDYTPDLVVFLAKSGFLFAMPMADVFGCDVVDIKVSRPGNGGKDAVSRLVPRMPRPLLHAALGSRALLRRNDANSVREAAATPRWEACDFGRYRKVLVVDDSVDTGWSVLEVLRLLGEAAPQAELRVAAYCVIDLSDGRVRVDYRRHDNTVVVTATSRYSDEHASFERAYADWRGGGGPR